MILHIFILIINVVVTDLSTRYSIEGVYCNRLSVTFCKANLTVELLCTGCTGGTSS